MFSFLYNLSDRQKDKKENYLCCMRNEIETKKSPSRHNPLTDLLFMAKKRIPALLFADKDRSES